jgi:hypothetical protein
MAEVGLRVNEVCKLDLGDGGGPATEPDRTLSRFGEVRMGCLGNRVRLSSVRSGSSAARL